MKKILIIITLLLFPTITYAKKIEVKLNKCIDGDTASLIIDKKKEKVRFIAIDSPEIDKNELYAKEAKEFTCELLTNAKKLYIEYDPKSDKKDKYERDIAWIWADKKLVQNEIVKNGYAKVAYLYSDYKYTSELIEFENYAKLNKLNIWNNDKAKSKVKKTKHTIKKEKNSFLDNINKFYDIIAILIAMILALVSTNISKLKKGKK